MTVNATWPGLRCFNPSLREMSLQDGGKMEETRTMLQAAIPALRSASSKLDRRSRCFPTPLVRKMFFATNAMSGAGVRCPLMYQSKKNCARKLASVRSDVNSFHVFEKLQLCERSGDCSVQTTSLIVANRNAGSQRVGDQFQLAKLGMSEIGSGIGHRLAFSGHLNHAHDFSACLNRRTHYFLNGISALLL